MSNITIKDVEDFFTSIGFTWKHSYYNHKQRRYVNAKKFKDIISIPYLTTFELYWGKNENEYYIDFFVSPTKFIRYREETNIMGSGSTSYADKDYSAQWVEFINNRKNSQNMEDVYLQTK